MLLLKLEIEVILGSVQKVMFNPCSARVWVLAWSHLSDHIVGFLTLEQALDIESKHLLGTKSYTTYK